MRGVAVKHVLTLCGCALRSCTVGWSCSGPCRGHGLGSGGWPASLRCQPVASTSRKAPSASRSIRTSSRWHIATGAISALASSRRMIRPGASPARTHAAFSCPDKKARPTSRCASSPSCRTYQATGRWSIQLTCVSASLGQTGSRRRWSLNARWPGVPDCLPTTYAAAEIRPSSPPTDRQAAHPRRSRHRRARPRGCRW